MSLKQQIDADIKQAMLAKEADRLRALREIKAQILLAESDGSGQSLDEEREIKILARMMKQRKESADIFRGQNRPDLAAREEGEMAVIEKYLPTQLSEDELRAKLQEIIARVGAKAPSDMGKVMGVATKELAGLAEGKAISAMVKNLLQ